MEMSFANPMPGHCAGEILDGTNVVVPTYEGGFGPHIDSMEDLTSTILSATFAWNMNKNGTGIFD